MRLDAPPSLRRIVGALALSMVSACATHMPTAPAGADSGTAVPANTPPAQAVATAVAALAAAAPVPAASAAASAAAVSAPPVAVTAIEVPMDPLRPEVPVDLNDRSARIDLWKRVRDGYGIPDLDDDHVRRRERYYAGKPDYVQRMAERGGRYHYHIVE